MNKQIFTVALLAGTLASASTLPAQDNRRSNTRQATVEDRLDQLEQNVADLQERVKRLEEGQQPSRGPAPPPQSSGSRQRTREQTQSSGEQQSFDVFYQGLQSGGHWFDDPTYGEIWQPDVASSDANWRPYSDGHWAYTDQGWTWISNEDFGWATYHYGRWVRRSDTGWAWVPGSRWAPAWVSWRESNEDVGWAPLPPEVTDDSQEPIEGWVDNYYDIGPTAYSFVKVSDLSRPSYRDALLPPESNVEFFTKTRNVTQIVYNNDIVAVNGPRYEQIASQAKIPSYKLHYVTGNEGRFGTNTKGDQLEVIAPAAKLQTTASVQPKVEKTLAQAQVDRGWQEIDKQKAAQLKQAIQQQAPVPANLPPKPAAAKPAIANPQNQPAQTSQQQPAAGNPPAPEASPQGQKGTATQQPAGQPPRPETSPAEAGRTKSPTPEKAPRTETRPSPAVSATPQRAPEQREQREPPAKPAPSPAEESKGRAPATEQAPRKEQQGTEQRREQPATEQRKEQPATEQRKEQPATERRSETGSRPESQREQPARKEEPVRKEESAPRKEEPPVRKEESSQPQQRPDAERRAEEKQPGRQSSESSRTEKKEPKQEKSKKEESPLQQ
jgi:hypothetical protein